MKVYHQYSGDEHSEAISLGGATYARAFDNCVAFGPLFPDELLTEHEPNERLVLSNLFRAMKIYAHGVYQLTR
jgi:acetylornithine deacetylase/succinyl-diaminopimelate desuccinylase-like protein